jgi:hypothetical protein
MTAAWILYALALVLLAVFWWKTRGQSFEALFERSAARHHHVLKVLKRHPAGGTWREVRAWMAEL